MVSTFTSNIHLEQPSNGSFTNTWDAPVNSNMSLVDQKFGYTTTVNITGASGTVALTQAQLTASIINLSGALTGNATFTVPSGLQGYWYFINGNSASSYTTTIGNAAGGTSITIPQGSGNNALLFSDGTNIKRASPFLDATYVYAATASLNDQSTKVATTQFVFNQIQGAQVALTGNTTLSASNAWPANILANSGSPFTLTFPATPRLVFSVNNIGSANVTLSFPNGSDFKGGGTTVTLLPNETVLLAGDGTVGYYRVVACGLTDGLAVGYRNIPKSANTTPAAADVGLYLNVSGGTTINSGIFSDGDAFVLVNNSGASATITQGAGTTLRLAGTTSTGSRSLAAYGEASVLCIGSNTFLVSGAGVS